MDTVPDESGQQHDAEKIGTARELLRPTPVEVGGKPAWCSEAMLNELRGLLDHGGKTLLADGREALVAEPYGLSADSLAKAERIAAKHRVECFVSANSWHFPGWTIRLVFVQPRPGTPTKRRSELPHPF